MLKGNPADFIADPASNQTGCQSAPDTIRVALTKEHPIISRDKA
jgi:hypothetical protein